MADSEVNQTVAVGEEGKWAEACAETDVRPLRVVIVVVTGMVDGGRCVELAVTLRGDGLWVRWCGGDELVEEEEKQRRWRNKGGNLEKAGKSGDKAWRGCLTSHILQHITSQHIATLHRRCENDIHSHAYTYKSVSKHRCNGHAAQLVRAPRSIGATYRYPLPGLLIWHDWKLNGLLNTIFDSKTPDMAILALDAAKMVADRYYHAPFQPIRVQSAHQLKLTSMHVCSFQGSQHPQQCPRICSGRRCLSRQRQVWVSCEDRG